MCDSFNRQKSQARLFVLIGFIRLKRLYCRHGKTGAALAVAWDRCARKRAGKPDLLPNKFILSAAVPKTSKSKFTTLSATDTGSRDSHLSVLSLLQYLQLLEFEKRLDTCLARKRLECQGALVNPQKIKKYIIKLCLHCSTTSSR